MSLETAAGLYLEQQYQDRRHECAATHAGQANHEANEQPGERHFGVDHHREVPQA